MAREQVTSVFFFFGKTKNNLYLLASNESLKRPSKHTSKDEECTY